MRKMMKILMVVLTLFVWCQTNKANAKFDLLGSSSSSGSKRPEIELIQGEINQSFSTSNQAAAKQKAFIASSSGIVSGLSLFRSVHTERTFKDLDGDGLDETVTIVRTDSTGRKTIENHLYQFNHRGNIAVDKFIRTTIVGNTERKELVVVQHAYDELDRNFQSATLSHSINDQGALGPELDNFIETVDFDSKSREISRTRTGTQQKADNSGGTEKVDSTTKTTYADEIDPTIQSDRIYHRVTLNNLTGDFEIETDVKNMAEFLKVLAARLDQNTPITLPEMLTLLKDNGETGITKFTGDLPASFLRITRAVAPGQEKENPNLAERYIYTVSPRFIEYHQSGKTRKEMGEDITLVKGGVVLNPLSSATVKLPDSIQVDEKTGTIPIAITSSDPNLIGGKVQVEISDETGKVLQSGEAIWALRSKGASLTVAPNADVPKEKPLKVTIKVLDHNENVVATSQPYPVTFPKPKVEIAAGEGQKTVKITGVSVTNPNDFGKDGIYELVLTGVELPAGKQLIATGSVEVVVDEQVFRVSLGNLAVTNGAVKFNLPASAKDALARLAGKKSTIQVSNAVIDGTKVDFSTQVTVDVHQGVGAPAAVGVPKVAGNRPPAEIAVKPLNGDQTKIDSTYSLIGGYYEVLKKYMEVYKKAMAQYDSGVKWADIDVVKNGTFDTKFQAEQAIFWKSKGEIDAALTALGLPPLHEGSTKSTWTERRTENEANTAIDITTLETVLRKLAPFKSPSVPDITI